MNNNNNFTPPVKLHSSQYLKDNSQVNRALFHDTAGGATPLAAAHHTDLNESEMLIHYNDEDAAETASILSLPSVVKAETDRLQKRPIQIEQLMNQVASSKRNKALLLDNSLANQLDATTSDNSEQHSFYSSPCLASHHMVSLNTSENLSDDTNNNGDEDDDEDEKLLLEFIEENYKSNSTTTTNGKCENKENQQNTSCSSDQQSTSLDEMMNSSSCNSSGELVSLESLVNDENVAIPDMQQYVNHVNRRVVEAELMAARLLPKIDEESEDEKSSSNTSGLSVKKQPGLTKRLSTSSISSTRSSACGGPTASLAKVVLTKTARLRMAQKFKEAEKTDSSLMFKCARPIAKPVSRLGGTVSSGTSSGSSVTIKSINPNQQPIMQRIAQKSSKIVSSASSLLHHHPFASSSSSSASSTSVLAPINNLHTHQFNKY